MRHIRQVESSKNMTYADNTINSGQGVVWYPAALYVNGVIGQEQTDSYFPPVPLHLGQSLIRLVVPASALNLDRSNI